MSTRLVLTLRVGPDTLVVGPPSAFGGHSDGRMIGRPGPNGREDARRWFMRACQEPGALIRIRHHMIVWSGDAHYINRLAEGDLPNYLANLCARGSLSMWASRPMGGNDARIFARIGNQAGPRGPVDTWRMGARTDFVLRLVPDRLTGTAHDEFLKLVSPEAMKVTSGILGVWAASHTFGPSDIIDVVLLARGSHPTNLSARVIADKMTSVLELIVTAKREDDLSEAADELAELVAVIGAPAFVALVTYAAAKTSRGGLKAKRGLVRNN